MSRRLQVCGASCISSQFSFRWGGWSWPCWGGLHSGNLQTRLSLGKSVVKHLLASPWETGRRRARADLLPGLGHRAKRW